jgi:glutathione synthase/RimK-type ligase-like ATP-grasp enzyme
VHEATIQSVNERAIELRAQGRLREAAAAFSEGIARFPDAAVLYNNLAMTLDEMGAAKEALRAYDSALAHAPAFTAALVGKANLLLRDGLADEARVCFDDALAADPHSVAANLGLYELLQIKGEPRAALEHQHRALAQQRLFTHVAPRQGRSVLVLCAPGDWQANVPVDFLFDRATTSVYKLYLLDATHMYEDKAPAADVIFNAIAESDDAVRYLALASEFIEKSDRPFLNSPSHVLRVGRRQLPSTLAGVDCVVAPITELTREAVGLTALPFAYPVIVRPVGSHAGHHLERVESSDQLESYAARVDAPAFFVSPFIDYSSGDGLFRKYRIVFVDGEPYPVHLAISPNWMIHYYNAPMAENEWMRQEEALFLSDPKSIFQGHLESALYGVAKAVGLEYFGIDCAVDKDGRLLIFEADPAMLVHTTDPVDLYPYKHEYVPRIFRAIEQMIDRRKPADT